MLSEGVPLRPVCSYFGRQIPPRHPLLLRTRISETRMTPIIYDKQLRDHTSGQAKVVICRNKDRVCNCLFAALYLIGDNPAGRGWRASALADATQVLQ